MRFEVIMADSLPLKLARTIAPRNGKLPDGESNPDYFAAKPRIDTEALLISWRIIRLLCLR
jgi:hypothetical protein